MAKSKFTNGNDNVTLTSRKGELANALAGDDTVTGALGADTIQGGEGNDLLKGGGGNDRVLGEAGDDTLQGDAGNNVLQGGNGEDTVDYSWYGTAQPIYINLAAGYAVDQVGLNGNAPPPGSGQTFSDSLTGVENAIGGLNTPNFIVGDIADNELTGGNGADTIVTGGGNDTVNGGAGEDYLLANVGPFGSPELLGGDGEDTFVFQPGGPGFVTIDYDAAGDQLLIYRGDYDDADFNIENFGGDIHLRIEFIDGGVVVEDILVDVPDTVAGAGATFLPGYFI